MTNDTEAAEHHMSGNRTERVRVPVGLVEELMTMRDYFAAQALAGIGAWTPAHGGNGLGSKAAMQARALWAYEQADAMMVEREKVDDDA